MIGTIIFWLAMIAMAVAVFYNRLTAGWNITCGYEKIEGEWVKTNSGYYYTVFTPVLSYFVIALVVAFLIYLVTAIVLDSSGLSKLLEIRTGLNAIKSFWNN